jgi:hypothetical protein
MSSQLLFDSLTTFINSPPGQIVAGGALAGIVWKFFEKVESVLSDQTKFEVAVWLLDRKKISLTFENWPETFAKVFDRVFGQKHLSWKCFLRSSIASLSFLLLLLSLSRNALPTLRHKWLDPTDYYFFPLFLLNAAVANLLPDFVSLLETRVMIGLMSRSPTVSRRILLLVIDGLATVVIALVGAFLGTLFQWTVVGYKEGDFQTEPGLARFLLSLNHLPFMVVKSLRVGLNFGVGVLYFYPAFFTSIWLWLYAGSGLILKSAQRFDIGFAWFNSRMDIEKHPLSSIGLVSSVLVALFYWTAALIRHFV